MDAEPENLGFVEHWLQVVLRDQHMIVSWIARAVRTGGAAVWAVTYFGLFFWARKPLGPLGTTIAVLVGVLVLAISLLYVPAWRFYRKERLREVDGGLEAAKTLERFYVGQGQATPREVLDMRDALMKIGRGINRAAP